MFEANEIEITWHGHLLFILIDRSNPGTKYKLNHELSTQYCWVYSYAGRPDKVFCRNIKLEEAVDAIYSELRRNCV